MSPIKSFEELSSKLSTLNNRKKIAVANSIDSHTILAVLRAVNKGFIEAWLIGPLDKIDKTLLAKIENKHFIHLVDVGDVLSATLEAVRMVKDNEADILMKGLVNTDVLLRAILDKEKGIAGTKKFISFCAALQIPTYHKLIFFADPVVIPSPSLIQRIEIIKYAINTARKFGVDEPKIALIHATEIANPKIQFMQDYIQILEMWRDGKFGDGVILDGPMDIFLALDKERGKIKNVDSRVLGNADILIFPNFESANCFYKGLSTFANAEMSGILQGTQKPVVLTSRSETENSKYFSIVMACLQCS